MNAIKTTNLTKDYGGGKGIIGLNLTVAEGEFFGFIGPNGAGKSTTIRTLLGLVAADGGSADVLGHDIVREKKQILRKTGYLPSETVFYPGMRVSDILSLSAGLRDVNCAAEAKRLCERLQLDMSQKTDTLSLGNRKKVAIVCALQHMPRLLILDEPTSGLDPLIQREFFAILRERNQAGATVFFSSHVLSEISRNCTHAAVIRDGRIVTADALSHSAAKRVTVHGSVDLTALSGVMSVTGQEGTVSFLYSGSKKELLHVLAAGEVSDLTISEPDLEEIFMQYYEKEGRQ